MVERILSAAERIKGVAVQTPLTSHPALSDYFECNLALKREDMQVVRSYKLRGAYNLISNLTDEDRDKGVVCASAGNHAQGVAFSCRQLGVQGTVFMPGTTPKQKVKQVKFFGKDYIEVRLEGDTFDDAFDEAKKYTEDHGATFVHPFNNEWIIAGQGTVAKEVIDDSQDDIDYLVVPIGGGGLISGMSSYFKNISPKTKIIGVEPQGASAFKSALESGEVVTLDKIDPFVDGAAVKRVGELNFEITKDLIDHVITIPEGEVCSWILKLYSEQAIVVEPAGALSIAALSYLKGEIKGKNVVAVVSGGNNDIDRMQEIKERSLIYEGLKHYFMIKFPQRAGALKEFVAEVLGPNDDITRFEYIKRNAREAGPALVGVELKFKEDYEKLIERLETKKINFRNLNSDPNLFEFFI